MTVDNFCSRKLVVNIALDAYAFHVHAIVK